MKTQSHQSFRYLALLLIISSSRLAWADPSCAARLGAGPAATALGNQLSLVSWNIQKASNPGWDADLKSLASDSELVFIQEAALEAGIPGLLPERMDHAFAPGYSTGSMTTGVMTLGAAAPSLHCQFAATEPWLRTPKATVVTEYVLEGRDERLLAVNLHAVNFSVGVSALEAQLAELASVLSQHRGPAIVAGDLNTWSQSRQQLVDVFMQQHGLAPVSFEPDLRSRPFGRALDHVYLRGLHAEAAEVVPVESSDHNPLRVQLALD